MLWSYLLWFFEKRISPLNQKRSLCTRLTCPLSSRRNKEESSGESPGTSLPTQPLYRMRVHSFSKLEITQRCFELRPQQTSLPYPSAVSHQVDFLCWIDSVLFALHCAAPVLQYVCVFIYGFCIGRHTLLPFIGFMCGPVCLLSSLSVFVYSGRWLVLDPLRVTSDVEEPCGFSHWLMSEDEFVYLQSTVQSSLFIQRGGGLLETCGWLAWGGTQPSISGCVIKI